MQLPAGAADIVASVESLWSARRRTATVVAVDDDQMILDTLRVLLADEDVFLVAVDDQEQFWRAVHDHHPDVIMLDVDMPEISGIELCRVLRSDDRWQQTGIIFLTAHRDAKTVHAVFEAGADDMVVKPIIGPELRARIASRIDRTDLHRRLAESDGLTGLTNRATSQRLTERMADAARATGRPLSVALVDLDHFKGVNDVHGHHAGDEVLRRFAALARDARPSLAGRWGGEEFLLVYDGIDARRGRRARRPHPRRPARGAVRRRRRRHVPVLVQRRRRRAGHRRQRHRRARPAGRRRPLPRPRRTAATRCSWRGPSGGSDDTSSA